MAIKRNNILSLIGNGRYHSCILTTFSFDFFFFEMKVMKWFRSCGIKNVNVFIDGFFYSELMQQVTGDEMNLSTGYSLYPIFETHIFHPKIWLLFGEKQGLLLVGSGNLTNSGNGNNDEIWGAYHFDLNQSGNALLFSAAWQYISKITAEVKGITKEKTTYWIVKHSPWLPELPKVTEFQFVDFPNGESVAFLYNTTNRSTIWQQFLQLIGKEEITEITTVSPYYDTDGDALKEIKTLFPKARIRVILEEAGIIPKSFPNDTDYSFYDWKDLNVSQRIRAGGKSKLHAKILHFKTAKDREYCLFGSANITSAGLGISKNANEEVSLLMKSATGGILDKIGIKLPANKTKNLSQFVGSKQDLMQPKKVENIRYEIQLLAAEIHYSTLSIYISKVFDRPVSVATYDKNDNLIKVHPIPFLQEKHDISFDTDEDALRYVQILNADRSKKLSNKMIAASYFSIATTYPTPHFAELDRACGQLQNGELRNVFDLIHYALIDESEKEEGTSVVATSKKRLNKNEEKIVADQTQLYDLSDYRPIESCSALKENTWLMSPSLRVLDAIKLTNTQSLILETDIRIDEQAEDISSMSGNDKSEVPPGKSISLRVLEADKRKLLKYLDGLYRYFHDNILFKNTRLPDYKLTITDLTKYLITLELIHRFGGKSEKVEEQSLFFTYLPVTGNYEDHHVKKYCLNIVGDFLRLAKNGFKDYTFDYTKKKFKQLQREALISTIVCIVNVYWLEKESFYLKTLLLNALHYLGWRSFEEVEKNLESLIKQVVEKSRDLKQTTRNFDTQLHYFSNEICRAYQSSILKREKGDFAERAKMGQIIYSSIAGVGYCYVVAVIEQNKYCLARPGFEWNPNKREYINHFRGPLYSPLPLNKVIIVDL